MVRKSIAQCKYPVWVLSSVQPGTIACLGSGVVAEHNEKKTLLAENSVFHRHTVAQSCPNIFQILSGVQVLRGVSEHLLAPASRHLTQGGEGLATMLCDRVTGAMG